MRQNGPADLMVDAVALHGHINHEVKTTNISSRGNHAWHNTTHKPHSRQDDHRFGLEGSGMKSPRDDHKEHVGGGSAHKPHSRQDDHRFGLEGSGMKSPHDDHKEHVGAGFNRAHISGAGVDKTVHEKHRVLDECGILARSAAVNVLHTGHLAKGSNVRSGVDGKGDHRPVHALSSLADTLSKLDQDSKSLSKIVIGNRDAHNAGGNSNRDVPISNTGRGSPSSQGAKRRHGDGDGYSLRDVHNAGGNSNWDFPSSNTGRGSPSSQGAKRRHGDGDGYNHKPRPGLGAGTYMASNGCLAGSQAKDDFNAAETQARFAGSFHDDSSGAGDAGCNSELTKFVQDEGSKIFMNSRTSGGSEEQRSSMEFGSGQAATQRRSVLQSLDSTLNSLDKDNLRVAMTRASNSLTTELLRPSTMQARLSKPSNDLTIEDSSQDGFGKSTKAAEHPSRKRLPDTSKIAGGDRPPSSSMARAGSHVIGGATPSTQGSAGPTKEAAGQFGDLGEIGANRRFAARKTQVEAFFSNSPEARKKVRMTIFFTDDRRGADIRIPDLSAEDSEENEEFKEFFAEYCTVKCRSRPLMTLTDLKTFFEDFQKQFPRLRVPNEPKINDTYSSAIEMQIDLCRKFQLTRAEANSGLCFESFQVVLTQTLKGRAG